MADGRMAMRRRLRYGPVSCLANMGTRCSRCPYLARNSSGHGSGPSVYLRLMGPHAARTSSSISRTLGVGVPSGRAINTTGGENPSSLSQRYTAPGLVPHSACSPARHAYTRSRSSRCTWAAARLFRCTMHSPSTAADGTGDPTLATACGVSGNRASSGICNSCSRCTRRRTAHQEWDVLSPVPRALSAGRWGGVRLLPQRSYRSLRCVYAGQNRRLRPSARPHLLGAMSHLSDQGRRALPSPQGHRRHRQWVRLVDVLGLQGRH